MDKINLHINVTEQDIREGCRSEASNCPIALAGNRALREQGIDYLYLNASPHFIAIHNDDEEAVFSCDSVPIDARVFMREFDSGEEVDPFEFDIEFYSL